LYAVGKTGALRKCNSIKIFRRKRTSLQHRSFSFFFVLFSESSRMEYSGENPAILMKEKQEEGLHGRE
jgi:hypothetical protein